MHGPENLTAADLAHEVAVVAVDPVTLALTLLLFAIPYLHSTKVSQHYQDKNTARPGGGSGHGH